MLKNPFPEFYKRVYFGKCGYSKNINNKKKHIVCHDFYVLIYIVFLSHKWINYCSKKLLTGKAYEYFEDMRNLTND